MKRLWAGLAMVVALGGGVYVATQNGAAGGSIACTIANRASWDTVAEGLGGTNCQYNGLVTRTNTAFNCSAALSTYGTLPLKVVLNYTASVDDNAFTLDTGCIGDGCSGPQLDTIDVIVQVNASGVTSGIGPTDDSAKTRQSPGPSCIQVTGIFEGGAPGGGSHPDCWQLQGGTQIDLVNAKSGDYAAGTSTAQGAGGCIFWTNATDFDVYGGEFVSCNHGLNGNVAKLGDGNTVQDAKFRTGRTESVATGGDPNCEGYSPSPACINVQDITRINVICESWNATTNTWDTSTPVN